MKTILHDAMALVALGLFVATIWVWTVILDDRCDITSQYVCQIASK